MRCPFGLSPNDVASLTGLSRKYVRRLIDTGQLKGFRVGVYRRVRPEELVAYLRERSLPTDRVDGLLPRTCPALLIVSSAALRPCELLAVSEDVTQACDLFQAGYLVSQREYRYVLLDTALGWPETQRVLRWLRQHRPLTMAGCLVYDDDGAYPDRWAELDWVRRWQQPVRWDQVAADLRQIL